MNKYILPLIFSLLISTKLIAQEDCQFSYNKVMFCSSDENAYPTVSNAGGLFSATPDGIILNKQTGEIDIKNCKEGLYTIAYTVKGDTCTNKIYITEMPNTNIIMSRREVNVNDTIVVSIKGAASSNTKYKWDLREAELVAGDIYTKGPLIIKWNQEGINNFNVIASNQQCGSGTHDYVNVVKAPTSINLSSLEQYTIRQDESTWSCSLPSAIAKSFRIVNIAGQTIDSQSLTGAEQQSLNYTTELLSNGLYFITIETNQGLITERIIITR